MDRLHSMNKAVGMIPARGGSKGLPRKNLRMLAGKPLIAWTIETAKQCAQFDRVVVSTDDPEIREVALAYGAEVPFLRPSELATDIATSFAVGLHLLDWLKIHGGGEPRWLVQLQPTSPLRSAADITACFRLQRETKADAVVSVCPVTHPPQWLRKLGPKYELLPLSDAPIPLRRQDSEPLYEFNGAVYLIDTAVFRATQSYFADKTVGYVMPPERSMDIDTVWDFQLAELWVTSQAGAELTPRQPA